MYQICGSIALIMKTKSIEILWNGKGFYEKGSDATCLADLMEWDNQENGSNEAGQLLRRQS